MYKILLVEDEEPLREVYKLILSTGPYEVATARDGKEALDCCAATTYDLILLDLMMPGLDGVGFLERFLAPSEPPDTKIIILSNLSSGKELSKAMSFGVRRSILKAELSPKQLLAAVRTELDG